MKRYLIFAVFFGVMLFAADTTPPSISNVGVNPNPFSPNTDGRNDNTTISFTLSEPCDSVIITIPADPLSPFNLGSMAAGDNQWTYGDSLGDGTYYFKIDAWDTAGNKADSVDGTFTEDVSPPSIDSISAAPNPFSPNGDGVKDYLYIDWDVTGTYPVGYDTLFNDTCLGYIVYDSTATPKLQYHQIHTFPPFNVYLYLKPADTYDHSITIKLVDFSANVVSTDLPANENNPAGYRVGDLTNKFNGPWLAGEEGMKSGVDSVGVYAFCGNTSISIYTDAGDFVYSSDYWKIFRGDGGYRHIIGPDAGLADGVYTYRIVAVDNADNTYEESHTFIVDNFPIKISSYDVTPDRISPQNQDFYDDKCTITYAITKPGNVNLKIYRNDTTLIRTLVNNVYQDSGSYSAVFDGKDSLGNFLAADTESTYIYVISAVDPLTSDANQVDGNVVVDNLAPAPPSLSQPATPTGNPTVDISGSAENSSTVKLYNNDIYVASATADASTGEFKFTGVALSEGNNVFKASATDEVGNVGNFSSTVTVVYDAHPPYLVSAFPADNSYIKQSPLDSVIVIVKDDASGVDISSSHITVRKSGTTVSGTETQIAPDTLIYTFNTPLSNTGTDDGVYSIQITPVDSVGNADTLYTTFTYDTQKPAITISPPDSSIINTFTSFTATITDNLSGADFSNSTISITGPGGTVPGDLTNDGNSTMTFTPNPALATNGGNDGRYNIATIAQDNAGNPDTVISTTLYDSRSPYVLKASPADSAYVTAPIAKVWARVSDTMPGVEISGVKWTSSSVNLLRSDSTIVAGAKSISGDTIFWNLNDSLKAPGNYIMEIYLEDNAGNSYRTYTGFIFDQTPPAIVWSNPKPDEKRNDTIPDVRVILTDGTGSGINYNTTITYITITDEGGNPVSGYTYYSGDTVIYHLSSSITPNSGSDGRYTVNVYAQDNAGNALSPNPISYTFLYDSDPAYVIETNPADSAYVNTPLSQVWARVSDAVAGHSYAGVDFGASRIFLQDAIDTTKFIPGAYSYSGDTISWSFGGIPDGYYIMNVNPKDSAGNESHYPYYFCYDVNPPSIDSILPLKQHTFATGVVDTLRFFVKDAGSGMDFTQSTVHIYNAVGFEVFGDISHSGDSLILYGLHNSLTPGGSDDGAYSIITTLQDKAGNFRVDTTNFVYDTRPPWIVSTSISGTINHSIDSVWVALADTDTISGVAISGVDPAGSKLDLYTYTDNDTSGITGSHYVINNSTLVFKFSYLKDGRYFMRVIKADKAGNVDTAQVYFKIDTQSPYVWAYSPFGYTQGPIGSLWLDVRDPEPKSKSIWSAKISLKKVSNNEYIPLDTAWLVNDTTIVDTLVVPLPDSGASYDGYYEEYVSLYDNAGNAYYDSSLSFILDNTAPTITASIPDSGHQNWRFSDNKVDSLRTVQVDVSDLVDGVDSVSGINFAASTITLYKPDGSTAPGTKTYLDNGNKTGTIYWHLFDEDSLPAGEYKMVVHIEDNTGNPPYTHGNSIDKVITFNAVSSVPEVISWIPSAPYVNNVTRVGAVLKDNSGTGIDTVNTTIKLENPSTNLVSGTKVWSGDTIFWYVSSMGSDGSYKIIIDAYSLDKSHSTISQGFIYDTKAPSVRDWSPADGQTVYTSPDTISITINDPSKSGITSVEDGRIFSRRNNTKGTKGTSPISYTNSSLLLYDISGHLIPGTKSYDDQKMAIYYDLDSALISSGTYTMIAVVMDEAGNSTTDTASFQFVSSTNEPVILSVFPRNDTNISTPLYSVYAEVQNYDTAQSYIEVQNLDGSPINGTKRFNGDTMFFDFLDTFAIDGTDNGTYHWYVHAILDTVERVDTLTFNYNVDLVCMAPVIDSGIPLGDSTIAESLYITGHSDSAAYDTLMVQNGDSIYTAGVKSIDSTFNFDIPLWYGNNQIMLWAVDTYGNRSDTTKIVVRRFEPKQISVQLPGGLPFRSGNNIFKIISTGSGTATLKLYNLAGEFVWEAQRDITKGQNPIQWNLTNTSGSTVKNGIYIYIIHITLQDGTNQVIRKLVAVIK